MTALTLPRIVIVVRKTPLELLLERFGTRTQAAFYLESRNQKLADYDAAHETFALALDAVLSRIPAARRRTKIDRTQLDRFLFNPDDVVVCVGQDGLVANVAKYLSGQLTIGINPDSKRYEGALARHSPQAFEKFLAHLSKPNPAEFTIETRTMVAAVREDGQRLLALNEVYVGHRTHQSSRYRISHRGITERHSSSGLIIATGTGATGWARSIANAVKRPTESLPTPTEVRLSYFVREAWPSVSTQTELVGGDVGDDSPLELESDMPEDGLSFGDGIESDPVEFLSGHKLSISVAEEQLRLVVPPKKAAAAST